MRTQFERVIASAILGTLLAAGLGAAVPVGATTAYTIRGTVACPTSQRVVGLWIQSSAGGSRFASGWRRFPSHPHVANYSQVITTTLPTTVALHVGCGGDAANWGSNNKSPGLSIASGSSRAVNTFCGGDGKCSWARNVGSPTPPSTNPLYPKYQYECTWYAAERWKSATGKYPNWYLGHAHTWNDAAGDLGWRIGKVPRPRSIAVWEPQHSGTAHGHVGWVDQVRINSDASVDMLISDRGWDPYDIRRDVWVRFKSGMTFVIPPPKSG